jgi:hypothetical protein
MSFVLIVKNYAKLAMFASTNDLPYLDKKGIVELLLLYNELVIVPCVYASRDSNTM